MSEGWSYLDHDVQNGTASIQNGVVKENRHRKNSWPKTKPGPQGTSEIELAPAKPVGVSKKFCLLDVTAQSHSPPAEAAVMTRVENTPHVPALTTFAMTHRRMFARPLLLRGLHRHVHLCPPRNAAYSA
jgi:hypothetical protein